MFCDKILKVRSKKHNYRLQVTNELYSVSTLLPKLFPAQMSFVYEVNRYDKIFTVMNFIICGDSIL